ncbi:MAG: hypothetical protein E7618_03960 [Ruminococcaceae bacterium]|nr:hypothetical protein [Oscillospiraceae bacterium]
MKRWMAIVLAGLFLLGLAACHKETWQGFYEEDLSRYLRLGDLETLTYTAYPTDVSEEEIDAVIAARLEAATELCETTEAVENGMTVRFDRYCFIRGVAKPTLSVKNAVGTVGVAYEDRVLSALLSHMIGTKQGETAEYTVTLPAGYADDIPSETEATYRITVLAVYEREVPPLTDALAAMLWPGCQTVEDMRQAIRQTLAAEKEKNASYKIQAELWEKLVSSSTLLALPTVLYREYYTELYLQYESQAAAESQALADYVGGTLQMTMEELENELKRRTDAAVKEDLVLFSLVRREGLSCTEADLLSYANGCARDSDGIFDSGEEYLAYYGEDAVTKQYFRDAVAVLLRRYATAS